MTRNAEDAMGWVKRRLPKKWWKRVCLYLLSGCVILVAADMLLVQYWRRVEIGYDTTRITSPLTAEGLPDYVAARNAECSKGVTVEDNAAPKLMTISSGGLVDYSDWLKAHPPQNADVDSEWDDAIHKSWKSAEHPDRITWLNSQEELLRQLDADLRKERFYVAWNSADPGVATAAVLPWAHQSRVCANLLAADAMRAAGDGDAPTFRRDVLNIAKLARLACQGSTLIEYLVAVAIDGEASIALQAGATAGILHADDVHQLLHAWQELPPFPDAGKVIDTGERYFALNTFCEGSRGSLRGAMGGVGTPNTMQQLFAPIHYNGTLRTFNHYYDELTASYRLPTYPQRAAANKAIADESIRSRNWLSMGDLLVAIVLPSLGKTLDLQERTFTAHDLATISLALRAFHEAHGNYPVDLSALRPDLLSAVPTDGFIDGPLHYHRDGQGYLLYSVGPDGQDDGGKGRSETKDGRRWDIAVRAVE